MKQESMNTQARNALSSSLESQTGDKYGGLIHQSIHKQLRNNLLRLFSYIHNSSSHSLSIYNAISVLRILQFFGPVLCINNNRLWPNESKEKGVISALSVLFHAFPAGYRLNSATILSGVYSILNGIMILLIVLSSQIFRTKSSIPQRISNIISIYYATLGEILHPIVLQLIFEKLSYNTLILKKSLIQSLISIDIIAIISIILHIFLVINITSQGLSFRPTSCITVSTKTQNIFFMITPILTIIFAFSSYCHQSTQIWINCLGGLIYFGCTYLSTYCGGFIDDIMNSSIFTLSIVSGLISFLFGLIIILNISVQMYMLISFIVLYVILYVISKSIHHSKKAQLLEKLDEINDSKTSIDLINEPNELMRMAIVGYINAHPSCLNWNIFRIGIEKWPKNVEIWYFFAKFVAIYPDENQTLIWILNNVISLKLKGNSARTLKMECTSILRERELNLSPILKGKLNSLSKKVQSCRNKLRHTWEMAIQGNINEIETAIKRSSSQIDDTETDFNRLLFQYPNNRFVTRSYSHFLEEIIADSERSRDMLERTKTLQRGIWVTDDKMKKLGLEVFPNLPSEIRKKEKSLTESHGVYTSDNQFNTENELEALDDLDKGNNDIIKEKIGSLSFPAIQFSYISQILAFFLFFLVLFVVLIVYFSYVNNDLLSPIEYIFQISKLRHNTAFSTTFSTRFIYESLGILKKTDTKTEKPPESLGSTWDIKEQLTFMMAELSQSAQIIEELRNFKDNDPTISRMKGLLFDPKIEYKIYKTPTDLFERSFSIQESVIDLLIQCERVTRMNESLINYSVLDTSVMLNPNANLDSILKGINQALQVFNEYIISTNNSYQKIFSYGMIIITVFLCFIYISLMIYQIRYIEQNKLETYRCLTSLPKSTLSNIVESMRMVKNDSDGSTTGKENEVSKQEENMIKIFNNVTSGKLISTNSFPIIVATSTLVVLSILILYIFFDLGTYESERLTVSVPHLDYLYASLDLIFGAIYSLVNLGTSMSEHFIKGRTIEETKKILLNRIADSSRYFRLSSVGGKSHDNMPFLGYVTKLKEIENKDQCNIADMKNSTLKQYLECFRVDVLFGMITPMLTEYVSIYESLNVSINPDDKMIKLVWNLLIDPIFETFFYPLINSIVPTITNDLDQKQSTNFFWISIIICVGCIIEFIILFQFSSIKKHMEFTLSMLLHCSESIIYQVPKIRAVLSGVFTSLSINSAKKDSDFYDDVLQYVSDGIICVNEEKSICIKNSAMSRIFGEKPIVGQNISDFFEDERFKGDFSQLEQLNPGTYYNISYRSDDDNTIELKIIIQHMVNKTIITIQDITQTIRYNTLISEEKTKSDKLLSSILPAKLVKRVQNGEKNISFSVQSASVLFIDIVEFTPWCSSNPATTVMSTLNALFKRFDAAIAKYSMMTKIKCIGDCYMAAGGIFTELNQPSIHAKEAVSFGLDALQAVKDINKEMGISLRIRVGINTGGPLVAGVLGIGKPTFEIFGPSISIAQQMEHHGIPMAVHISRPVYELIYGNAFNVKERGSIEIKTGSVVTYLVA